MSLQTQTPRVVADKIAHYSTFHSVQVFQNLIMSLEFWNIHISMDHAIVNCEASQIHMLKQIIL